MEVHNVVMLKYNIKCNSNKYTVNTNKNNKKESSDFQNEKSNKGTSGQLN